MMSGKTIQSETVLTLLAAAPERITALMEALSERQLHISPVAGEWNAIEVLAHLRSCADVWGGCIADILGADHPTLRAINPVTWVKRTNYRSLDFWPSLQAYSEQRTHLLDLLTLLDEADWLRSATVTGAGKPLERDVHFYAQWLAKHERSHLKQFRQIANFARNQ
jgi:DinB superfamily